MILLSLFPSLLCCLVNNLLNKDLHTLYVLSHDLFRFDLSIFILICVDEEMEKFCRIFYWCMLALESSSSLNVI